MWMNLETMTRALRLELKKNCCCKMKDLERMGIEERTDVGKGKEKESK